MVIDEKCIVLIDKLNYYRSRTAYVVFYSLIRLTVEFRHTTFDRIDYLA